MRGLGDSTYCSTRPWDPACQAPQVPAYVSPGNPGLPLRTSGGGDEISYFQLEIAQIDEMLSDTSNAWNIKRLKAARKKLVRALNNYKRRHHLSGGGMLAELGLGADPVLMGPPPPPGMSVGPNMSYAAPSGKTASMIDAITGGLTRVIGAVGQARQPVQQMPMTNYLPLVLGGVAVLALGGFLVTRRKK